MLDAINAYVATTFQTIGDYYHSVIDVLNPYSPGNVILFFTWVVVYTFTSIAVWRSERAWFRFICFVVNQIFSIGVLNTLVSTATLAWTYWHQALGAFVVTGASSLFLFRRRRR